MLRNVISRCRNSRFITLVCVASIFTNIVLIISTRHTHTDIVKYTSDVDSFSSEFHKYQNQGSNISDKLLGLLTTDPSNATRTRQLLHEPVKEVEVKEEMHTVCNICPYDPPELLGPLADMTEDMNASTLAAVFPDMATARLQPKDCVARQRIAVIIPYRNRYPHLHILLHNLIPFLIRQQADATFFVIEQAPPETFNRGALLNVGFLEADKIDKFDCYIFHDVDLIPLDDRHLYRCGDNPKHFAVAMNKYNFRLPYRDYFGGAVGFSRRQYMEINGCSNVYFGWGGEDDELKDRVLNRGYIITRSPVNIARYDMIKHTRDKGNEANPVRKRILSTATRRQDIEGLNTITYKVNSVKSENLYIWINVSLNRTAILESAPKYILDAILETEKPVKTTPKRRIKARELTHQKSESPQEASNLGTKAPTKETVKATPDIVKS